MSTSYVPGCGTILLNAVCENKLDLVRILLEYGFVFFTLDILTLSKRIQKDLFQGWPHCQSWWSWEFEFCSWICRGQPMSSSVGDSARVHGNSERCETSPAEKADVSSWCWRRFCQDDAQHSSGNGANILKLGSHISPGEWKQCGGQRNYSARSRW